MGTLLVVAIIISGLWTGFCHSIGYELGSWMHWFGYVSVGLFWGFLATVKALLD